MQDVELFLSLAEIAGVFVGFGTLVAVRGGSTIGAGEISDLRWVLTNGAWVVVVALAPVALSRYGAAGHELWLVCSLIALALFLGMFAINYRTPEWRDSMKQAPDYPRAKLAAMMVSNALLLVPMVAALVLVALGLFPGQDSALYSTAVVLGLCLTAWTLVASVFWTPPGRPDGR